MKKILFILSAVLFGLLLGTGLQFLFTGMFTLTTPNFEIYTVWNWVFQSMYWMMITCVSAFLATEATEDDGF